MKVTTDGCLFGAWIASQMQGKSVEKMLDIGTGTGLLTLMLAQRLTAQFDAIEIDKNASEEAEQNFNKSKWKGSIKLYQQSIQDFEPNDKYDLIVCNPPFFDRNLKGNSDSRNLAIHNDELNAAQLAEQIDRLLKPDGKAFVMYPAYEMESFQNKAQSLGLYVDNALTIRDKEGQSPIRVLSAYSRNEGAFNSSELIIKEEGDYSKDFKSLLRDYYLHL